MKRWPPVLLFALLCFVVLLYQNGCSPTERVTTSPSPEATHTRTLEPSATRDAKAAYLPTYEAKMTLRATLATSTKQIIPSRTPTVTSTPKNTPTIVPSLPPGTPKGVGTPLSPVTEVIHAENVGQLREVAHWGKGDIMDVVFTPDGSMWIVGSAHGVALYDVQNMKDPPTWIPFSTPFRYDDFYISEDGEYLLMENFRSERYFDLSSGSFLEVAPQVNWLGVHIEQDPWGAYAVSPDGTLEFWGGRKYGSEAEFNPDAEYAWGRMVDTQSGELIYELRDEPFYISIYDRTYPEGCDLAFFSPCGHAYASLVSSPYRAAFSFDGSTFSVLYRPPSLGFPQEFSTLRIYQVGDGKLLKIIGSLDHPVEDFAYSLDGKLLLVAFTDGSIMLWDIKAEEVVFSAWHFNPSMPYVAFSRDGQFLIIQYPWLLEVRNVRDGALRSRYESTSYAVSNSQNWLAIGSETGEVWVLDIGTGETIQKFEAHEDRVYALAFSPDSRYLASSSEDCRIRLWSIETGTLVHPFEQTVVNAYGAPDLASRILIHFLEFIPSTNQIVGFGSWGTAVNWNVDSGATNYVIESDPLEYYQGMITIKPHFPEFFSVDLEQQSFYINNLEYNLSDGSATGQLEFPGNLPENCGFPGPTTMDGSLLFTKGYDFLEGKICILNPVNMQLLGTIEVVPQSALDDEEMGWLYVSPTGHHLAVTTFSGIIYIYQIEP